MYALIKRETIDITSSGHFSIIRDVIVNNVSILSDLFFNSCATVYNFGSVSISERFNLKRTVDTSKIAFNRHMHGSSE